MKVPKILTLITVMGITALLARQAQAWVTAAADAHSHIRIGYPDEQQVTQHVVHTFPIYAESLAHTNLPPGTSGICEGYGFAQRFHLWFVSWTYTNYWGHCSDGYNPKHAGGKASAWGSTYIIDGPPGATAQLRAVIPATKNVAIPPEDEAPPLIPQGMYADSFFDVFTEVNVGIVPPGQPTVTPLLTATAHLAGPESPAPGLTAAGDLAGAMEVSGGGGRIQAVLCHDVASPISVPIPTGVEFEVPISVSVWTPEKEEVFMPDGGFGASFAVRLELVDDQGGTLVLRETPEPATWSLLAIGGLCVAAYARRKTRG